MKSNNQILQLGLFLFTTTHFPVKPVTCYDIMSTYTIQNAKKISNPDAISDLASYFVASKMECSHLCSDHPLCQAFFLTKSTTREDNFQCKLMKTHVGEEHLTHGEGTYGFLAHFSVSEKSEYFPSLKDGKFVRVEKGEYGISAFYDCYPGYPSTTGIGIVLYDDPLKAMPRLNTPCSDSLCQVTGLSNTLLKITSMEEQGTETTYQAHVICPEGETHQSDAACSGATGNWTFSHPIFEVGCAPTTCFSVDRKYKIYGGTLSQTINNEECQRWDALTPHWHHYKGLIDDAGNSCRDPDGMAAPWCYQMTDVNDTRWGFCDIPPC